MYVVWIAESEDSNNNNNNNTSNLQSFIISKLIKIKLSPNPIFFRINMAQFKTLFIFALFALMMAGIVSRPSFLGEEEPKISVLGDCPADQYACGKVCCQSGQQCYGWAGRFWCS